MRGNLMATTAVTIIACSLLLLVIIQDMDGGGAVEAWAHRRRALAEKQSVLLKSTSIGRGCNTFPNICKVRNKNEQCCYGVCINVRSNKMHCGGCGKPCGANQSCCSKSCTDLRSDRANCGKCGNACADGIACKDKFCGGYAE